MKSAFCEPCFALGEVEKCQEGILQRAVSGGRSFALGFAGSLLYNAANLEDHS
jgi:hypothetical protein